MNNTVKKLRLTKFAAATAGVKALCLAFTICLSTCAGALAEPAWKSAFDQGQNFITEQNPAEAEKSFRRALTLSKQAGGSSTAIDECQMKLADTLALRNETVEANYLYNDLLHRLTGKYGNSTHLVPVLNALGSIQEALGDHATAITYYQRALKLNEKNLGPYSPAFAENLHSLARANAKAGNKKTAEKQYKQSISILMSEPGLSAADRLQNVMVDYSDLMKNDDDSNKSLIDDFKKDILSKNVVGTPAAAQDSVGSSDFNKASSVLGATQPTPTPIPTPTPTSQTSQIPTNAQTSAVDSPELRPAIASGVPPSGNTAVESASKAATPVVSATSLWQNQMSVNSASSRQSQINEDPDVVVRGLPQPWSDTTLLPAYKIVNDSIVSQGRFGQGAEYYQRMIAADLNALGPNHPSVGNDLNGLAHSYMHQKEFAKAEPLLLKASSIYQQSYGDRNLLSINTIADLAFVEFHLGKVDRAIELYQKALSNSQSALGPDSFETARILNELAYLYFHQGKLKEASTTYKWALASTEAAVGKESPLLAACMKDYALVLRSLGEPGEASKMDSRADDISSRQPKLKS